MIFIWIWLQSRKLEFCTYDWLLNVLPVRNFQLAPLSNIFDWTKKYMFFIFSIGILFPQPTVCYWNKDVAYLLNEISILSGSFLCTQNIIAGVDSSHNFYRPKREGFDLITKAMRTYIPTRPFCNSLKEPRPQRRITKRRSVSGQNCYCLCLEIIIRAHLLIF